MIDLYSGSRSGKLFQLFSHAAIYFLYSVKQQQQMHFSFVILYFLFAHVAYYYLNERHKFQMNMLLLLLSLNDKFNINS